MGGDGCQGLRSWAAWLTKGVRHALDTGLVRLRSGHELWSTFSGQIALIAP
jgi:hypothetical protein